MAPRCLRYERDLHVATEPLDRGANQIHTNATPGYSRNDLGRGDPRRKYGFCQRFVAGLC
jgi:hypothetical protein